MATVVTTKIHELNAEQTLAHLAVEISELYFEFRTASCGGGGSSRRMEIVTLASNGSGDQMAKKNGRLLSSLRLAVTATGQLELNGDLVASVAGRSRDKTF